jgi:Ca2+-binding RTX toxin-like protein
MRGPHVRFCERREGVILRAYSTRINLAHGAVAGGDGAVGDVLSGIENLSGSAHADRLTGDAGANVLSGGGGDDVLTGGGGDDVLAGGAGNDSFVFTGEWGRDTIVDFSKGDKVLLDAASYAELEGALAGAAQHYDPVLGSYVVLWFSLSGRQITFKNTELSALSLEDFGLAPEAERAPGQVLAGTEGADVLLGGDGDDRFIGSAGADVLMGGAGIDTVDYSASREGVQVDLVANRGTGGDAAGDGYAGVENLVGSAHSDELVGNDAANRIEGGAGDDLIIGGAGDDVLVGGAGADMLSGDDGHDTADYSGAAEGIVVSLDRSLEHAGEAAGDYLSGIETVVGTRHDDVIRGDQGANHLVGGDWDDRLEGEAGADVIDGGAGVDTADYAGSSAGVRVDLGAGTATGGDAEGDVLLGIENLSGSDHADRLVGDAGANMLSGGAGDDVLEGGAGDDLLEGGAGNDSFVFSGEWGRDSIADFADGDLVTLDADSYAQLDAALANAAEQYDPATGSSAVTLTFDATGKSITLQNTERADLSADNFSLAS